MANRFSKKYGNKGAFNYLRIKDAYQHLMLHPYITVSRTIVNIILSKIEFRHWTLRGLLSALGKGISYVYAISFLFSKCSTFPASCGHGQSYSSISHTLVHNTWILTTESISVLAACS